MVLVIFGALTPLFALIAFIRARPRGGSGMGGNGQTTRIWVLVGAVVICLL